MCGIVGLLCWDGSTPDSSLVRAMAGELAHRGPDESAVWCSGPVAFGHTRLSIIDPAGSAQPMTDVTGRITVTFNGEILNYRQLRAELDYPFRTDGDTEVLLAVYRRHGIDGVDRLRGQFAFALHDEETEVVHFVRDRLGVLPLYYYVDDRILAFASEVKALLRAVGRVEVDQESLNDYLAHRAVPAPHTLLRGIRKLMPGSRLEVRGRYDIRTIRYWQVPAPNPQHYTPDEAVRRVDQALSDSVDEALIADVPVGCYLSGGVDSSLITALAVKARGGAEVHTYAAGFGDARRDDLPWARKVSGLLGTRHHEVTVAPDDFMDLWPLLSWHRDGPLSEPADVAVFRLAQLAGRDVKVVLSGEGSDELFGGYPKHRFATATSWAGAVPAPLRRAALGAAERLLPAGGERLGIALRAASGSDAAERMRGWFAPFTEEERTTLLRTPPSRPVADWYTQTRGGALNRMLFADTHSWLSDNLLERGDRMSMAASVELRPPFIDHRIVELAFALPNSVKIRRGVSKWVVKEVARRYLPAAVVDRPKIGFHVPLDRWFRQGLRPLAGDLLTSPSSFVCEVLDRRAVTDLLARHDSGQRNEQSRIWTLLALEIWHQQLCARTAERSEVVTK